LSTDVYGMGVPYVKRNLKPTEIIGQLK